MFTSGSMEYDTYRLLSREQADILAANSLLKSLRQSYFRLKPNEAPNASDLNWALESLGTAKAEKINRWFHVKIHLPLSTQEGDYDQAIKVCNQKWVIQGAFTFEKWSKKKNGPGKPHIHLLCEATQCAGHIRRDIVRSLSLPSNQVKVFPVTTTTYRRNTANYICKNHLYDVSWRAGLGIDPVYFVNITPQQYEDLKNKD